MNHFFSKCIKAAVLFYCLLWSAVDITAQVNTYTLMPSVGTFSSISGSTIIPMIDNKLDTIATPTFSFNNQSFSSIVVSSNGFVVLGDTHAYLKGTYTPISATYSAGGVLSPFGRDLLPVDSNATILYEVVGTEIVVQWTHVKRPGTTGEDLTFQVRIDTLSALVKFVYGNFNFANASTHPQIGLRGASATDYVNLNILNAAGKSWLQPELGTVNTAIAVLRADMNSTPPTTGLTYTWIPATCFVPANFANIGMTESSLDFSWGRSIAAGEIAMYPSGGSIANATFIPVSGTSVSIPNLTPDTRYSFQLREICAVGDSSAWSTMLSAKTACNPITTLPWSEDFEGILSNITSASVGGALPSTCWAYRGDISGAQGVQSAARRARSGTKYLTTNYSTAATTGDVVYTPGFELEKDSSYTFSFWYKADGRTWDTIRALVGTTQDAMNMQVIGSPVYAFSDSVDYVKYFGHFVPNVSGVYYFGANVFAGSLVTNFCFDDFKVEKTPTCGELYPATIGNVTATTAEISWTSNHAVELVVVGASQTIAEGTIVPFPNNINNYVVSGLLPGRNYKIYIRQICSATETSDWSAAAKLTTSCAVLTAPWFEDFENTLMQVSTSNPIPLCWAKTGDFKGETTSGTNNRGPISGNNYVYTQYSTVANLGDRLFTPTFQLYEGVTYEFAFNYAKPNASGNFDSVTVSLVRDQSGTNAEILGAIGLLTNIVDSHFVVSFTPSSTGEYNFMLSVFAGSSPWHLIFDDFSLTQSCLAATVDLTTTNSCDLNSGVIAATVTGGVAPYTYLWSNAATDAVLTQVEVDVVYSLTVTDAIGCTFTADTSVTQFAPYSVAATSTNATCPTCTDGTVTLIVLNAVNPTFVWSNGETSQNLLALAADTYTVTVTDENGCSKIISLSVGADIPEEEEEEEEIAVDEANLAAQIKMYPNPATQLVTLAGFNARTQVFVVNNLGQVVLENIVETAQIQLDLSHLPASTYWVRLQSEKGNATLSLIKAE